MTVTPKTAGLAVIGIGGTAAAGYGASKLVNKEVETALEASIKLAGFSIIDEKTEACTTALKGNDYKTAVVKCAKEKTFKERALKLNLKPLTTENLANTNGDWGTKWSKRQTEIEALNASASTKTSANNFATEIKALCDGKESFSESSKTSEWYKYLKICIKEDGTEANDPKKLEEALRKDFWYNKDTFESKMSDAKFVKKTSNGCSDEKLHKVFEEGEYKTLIIECSQLSDFRTRATELKIDAYPANGEDTFFQSEWATVKDRVKKVITTITTDKEGTWNSAKEEVKNYCTNASNNKTINATVTNKEWQDYLNACTKDKTTGNDNVTTASIVAKDFWTGNSITKTISSPTTAQ